MYRHGQIFITLLLFNLQRAMSIEINPLINRHLMLISAVDSFCAIRAIDGAKQIKTLAFGGEASTNRATGSEVAVYSP